MGARRTGGLRTADLARAVGVHPNTVRRYEAYGYLPPVPRSPTGYRMFTETHLDHLRLATLLLRDRWPGRAVRRSAYAVLAGAVRDGLAGSAAAAGAHLAIVRRERAAAERACEVARGWMPPGKAQRYAGGGSEWNSPDGRGTPRDAGHGGECEPPDGRPWYASAGGGLRSGEVVRLLGLTYDTLRSWERSGLYRAGRDPATGERRFGAAELDRLSVIRALRQAGYSPMAVLRMLNAADAGDSRRAMDALIDPGDDEDLVTAGDRWLATLEDHERCAVRALALVRGRSARDTLVAGQKATESSTLP